MVADPQRVSGPLCKLCEKAGTKCLCFLGVNGSQFSLRKYSSAQFLSRSHIQLFNRPFIPSGSELLLMSPQRLIIGHVILVI